MYIIKALYFGLRAAIANSFFLINLTCLVVGSTFLVV